MVTYGPPQSWYTTETPKVATASTNWTYGQDFTFAVAGRVTALRYYRYAVGAAATSTLMRVYSTGGVEMASASTTGESAVGWYTATLSAPLAITTGLKVRVSAELSGSRIPTTQTGIPTPTHGDLTMGNGWFRASIGYPNVDNGVNRHFIDVVFEAEIATPVEPPVIPPVEPRPPVPAVDVVEVWLKAVPVDPAMIVLPISVTHGRSAVGVQPDPPTAQIVWDGPACPYIVGDSVEIWAGVEGFLTATYDDPVARYDDDSALYGGGTDGALSRRFLGRIAGITTSGRYGTVGGWQLDCVGSIVKTAGYHRKISRPVEDDVARVLGIAGTFGFGMVILGTPTVSFAAAELDGDMLSLWQDVCVASGGLLWQSADGDIVYETGNHRATNSQPVGTVQAAVLDHEVRWQAAVEDIVNSVTVKWGADSAAEVTATDPDSVAWTWGERHADITTTLAAESDADQLAALVLARRAWPFYGTTTGLVQVDELDAGALAQFQALEIGTPVLVPIPETPGPTPAAPTPVVVEGWIETWDDNEHTAQMAFSDQKRWALTTLRDYDDVRGHDYAYWKAGDYMNMLVEVPA